MKTRDWLILAAVAVVIYYAYQLEQGVTNFLPNLWNDLTDPLENAGRVLSQAIPTPAPLGDTSNPDDLDAYDWAAVI